MYSRAAEQGAIAPPPPQNCTVGLSSVHYVQPSAVCKSFSPPNLILLPPPLHVLSKDHDLYSDIARWMELLS